MGWIEAARGAPAGATSAVPIPPRRPPAPAMAARRVQSVTAPDPKPAPAAGESGSAKPREAAVTRLASVAPPPARKPAVAGQVALPASPQAVSRPERKPPARSAAREKRKAAPASREAKCKALGRCRDAFARCKAAFVKKEGAWDLEKQPCGAKYKTCINKSFAPGEMFFTRWFWPYEECP